MINFFGTNLKKEEVSKNFGGKESGGSTIGREITEENRSGDILSRVNSLEKKSKENLRKAKGIEKVVYLGFLIMLLMVVGIFFQYFKETLMPLNNYVEIRNDYLLEQGFLGCSKSLSEQKKETDELKNKIECLKGKQSWEYKYCF